MKEWKIKDAVDILTTALRSDKDFYYSWQANIAIQFQDKWDEVAKESGLPCTREHIHDIANNAAKNFLDLLCYIPDPENE